jgi:propanediol dehydratase small subunit
MGERSEDDPRKGESALALEDLTLDALRAGKVTASDLTIKRATLLDQARLAQERGYPQLARNFRRAAELTAIPNDVLIETYEKLRPYRATYYQLLSLAQEIAARYDAPETGDYIRQAAEAYQSKGLVKAADES